MTLFRVARGLRMVEKRLSQLIGCDSFLIRAYGEDDRIHEVINPTGTRATHFQPDFAQVLSANKPYGHRFGPCFETYPGWVFVGANAEGAERGDFGHCTTPFDRGGNATASLRDHPHGGCPNYLGFVCEDEVRDKKNKLHVILREAAK